MAPIDTPLEMPLEMPALAVGEAPTAPACRGPWDESLPRVAQRAAGVPLRGTPYLVVKQIGYGGMGEIYEVEHAALQRRAALKVLHRNHLDRPDLAARLRDEARHLAQLRHPNLVEVFDLGVTEDGRPYFAMPLLRGHDLRAELERKGPLSAVLALKLVAQVLDGLAAVHAVGLVHRDVKLENLFLENEGTVRVLDFGIAKRIREEGIGRTVPGASPGTPRNMAPEQCFGEAVDARTDLYAAGLVLYELCTGQGPFDALRSNEPAMRFAHFVQQPRAPSELAPHPVPPGLDALILRALAKSPHERFQSAAEMAAALRTLLPLNQPLETPASRSARAKRRKRTRASLAPWLAAIGSALAVALFALGLVFGRTFLLFSGTDRTTPALAKQ